MLKIRTEQLQGIAAGVKKEADERMVAYARKRFPAVFTTRTDEDLSELVSAVRLTAKRYGIDREGDVATFLDFTVMYGAEFHRAPWSAGVLDNPRLHGPDKVAILRQKVRNAGAMI